MAWRINLLMLPLLLGASPASQPVQQVGRLEARDLRESSGVVASRRHAGVLWTHNDSGHAPTLFAVDKAGKLIAQYAVGAPNIDWEDIAIDADGRIYIADIGNNQANRKDVLIHRLDEPDPAKPDANLKLVPTRTWRVRYPDRPFDSEAFFVHSDHGYMISKLLTFQQAGLYRFPLNKADAVALEKVCDLPIRAPVTAADISADGKRLAVLTYLGLSVFAIDGNPATSGKVEPVGVRLVNPKIEACGFTKDGVIVTAETGEVFELHPKDK